MALASCFFPLPPPSRGACSRAHSAAAGTATSPPSSGTLEAILSSRIIACLRAQDADTAMEAACAALSGGISVLEIVMSTPGVLEVVLLFHHVVKELLNHYPSSVIGVGTVLNAEDARKAVNAGAGFLMSPGTIMEILVDHHNSNVLYIPGAMTPTEVLFAHNTGARIVKVAKDIFLQLRNHFPIFQWLLRKASQQVVYIKRIEFFTYFLMLNSSPFIIFFCNIRFSFLAHRIQMDRISTISCIVCSLLVQKFISVICRH
ncbi:uncharacterized protein LOC121967767 isoform X1 [Zingiber officinale]|uniref:uncharacterized protein LOC121967767 isoform X1 n=2 Tax=Zingiber officinale TaxID=94328 RepID=UPI001C4D11C2|nr:uncharacterized protein LOC121967767 isoform X1 [Zingiber officinale]